MSEKWKRWLDRWNLMLLPDVYLNISPIQEIDWICNLFFSGVSAYCPYGSTLPRACMQAGAPIVFTARSIFSLDSRLTSNFDRRSGEWAFARRRCCLPPVVKGDDQPILRKLLFFLVVSASRSQIDLCSRLIQTRRWLRMEAQAVLGPSDIVLLPGLHVREITCMLETRILLKIVRREAKQILLEDRQTDRRTNGQVSDLMFPRVTRLKEIIIVYF